MALKRARVGRLSEVAAEKAQEEAELLMRLSQEGMWAGFEGKWGSEGRCWGVVHVVLMFFAWFRSRFWQECPQILRCFDFRLLPGSLPVSAASDLNHFEFILNRSRFLWGLWVKTISKPVKTA